MKRPSEMLKVQNLPCFWNKNTPLLSFIFIKSNFIFSLYKLSMLACWETIRIAQNKNNKNICIGTPKNGTNFEAFH